MRRATLLLALALVLAPGIGSSPALAATPQTPTLDAMEHLWPLRLSDPPAFIAGIQAMEAAQSPTDPITRETLHLLGGQSLALQGRYDEARRVAVPIADHGLTRTLRVRANVLIVHLMATSRQFLEGQQRLEPLLAEVDTLDDAGLRRHVHLVAAIFYNQLSQPEPAERYAKAVLAAAPDVVERCAAELQALEARVRMASAHLDDRRFVEAAANCDAAGGGLLRGFVDVAHARWLLREDRIPEAAAMLRARMPAITATGVPRLRGEAHALLADALQRSGELDAAERETEAALVLSASLPTGLPLLLARRTRYAIALARGDTAGALRELQAVVTAERAYSEEMRRLQEAYLAGRSDAMQREQTAALLLERNARLVLESERARHSTAVFEMLLVPVGLGLLALAVWAARSRVQQRRLQRSMQVDALTGLWTRAHFTAQAAVALAHAERQARPMALLLIDLDHFSQVNARFGHLSGDRLLTAVGAALRSLESEGRRFGRLGGEEFAVLLPGAGLDEGLAFAEHCRAVLAETSAPALDDGARMAITASFGVVSTTAAGFRLRDLLANADQALYRAKNAGRNRVAAAAVAPVSANAA